MLGELRSLAHRPTRSSWEAICDHLEPGISLPDEELDYLVGLLRRWPRSVPRDCPARWRAMLLGAERCPQLALVDRLEIEGQEGLALLGGELDVMRSCRSLRIRSAGLADEHCGALIEKLAQLPELEHLDLSDNDLGDRLAVELLEALADGRLPRLLTVELWNNPIGPRAEQRLRGQPSLRCPTAQDALILSHDRVGDQSWTAARWMPQAQTVTIGSQPGVDWQLRGIARGWRARLEARGFEIWLCQPQGAALRLQRRGHSAETGEELRLCHGDVLTLSWQPLLRVQMRLEALEQPVQTALSATIRDDHTGLFRKRLAHSTLRALLRARQPVTLALLDLDHFKSFNEQHGFPAGDRALQHIATCLLDRFAARDDRLLFRFGGEEFGLLLWGCSEEEAIVEVEQARSAIGALSQGAGRPTISASAGLAQVLGDGGDVERQAAALYRCVDGRLQCAKQRGRDQLVRDERDHEV